MQQKPGTTNQETVEAVSGLKIFFDRGVQLVRPVGPWSSFPVSMPTAVITGG